MFGRVVINAEFRLKGVWMSDQALSALLDGECSDAELDRLLRGMDDTPELAQAWSHLCRNRDLREGVRIGSAQPCIASSVMARLPRESAPRSVSPKVVSLASWRSRVAQVGWRPVAGFAAAASMGAAAVLLVAPAQRGSSAAEAVAGVSTSNADFKTVQDRETYRSSGGLQNVSVTNPNGQGWSVSEESQSQQLRDNEQLRDYLMDHSNSVGDQGVGGTLRYARFAAHTADYRIPADEPR